LNPVQRLQVMNAKRRPPSVSLATTRATGSLDQSEPLPTRGVGVRENFGHNKTIVSRTGYTAGVFDLFHIGHLTLLEEARRHCDRLIVGVTSDELSTSFKHKIPIIPYRERAAIVAALRCVDEVIPQNSMDRWSVWEERHFNVTIVGDDWKNSDKWNSYEQRFAEVGVEVAYVHNAGRVSSTLLRATLEKVAATPRDVISGADSHAA
jgi:glycerol-3-phosphate cytidylyltransferase